MKYKFFAYLSSITLFFAAGALFLTCQDADAQTASSWLSDESGDWTDPLFWSTDPTYPKNGSPSSGSTYDVLIDAEGNPYTVTLDFNGPEIEVDQLTLDSADATLYLNYNFFGLTANSGLVINEGKLLVNSGYLYDTVLSGTNGSVEFRQVIGNQRSYLTNVTFAIDAGIYDGASVGIDENLFLDQSTLTLRSETSGTSSISGLEFGSSTRTDLNLLGQGRIELQGRASISPGSDKQIYIGSGIEVISNGLFGGTRQIFADTVVNDGLITSDGQFSLLEVEANLIQNNGLIQAANQGRINIIARGVDLLSSDLGMLKTDETGRIWFKARINNQGSTLDVSGPNRANIVVDQINSNNLGWIDGGTIVTDADAPLLLYNWGELRNTTLQGAVTGTGTIRNGLVLNNGSVLLEAGGYITFAGDQSVSGTGSVEILSQPNGSGGELRIGDGTGTVTFGSDITLHSKVDLRNEIMTNDFINNGTILFDGTPRGGGIGNGLTGTFTNNGLIHIRGGDVGLRGNGLLNPAVNNGDIIIDGGVTGSLGEGFVNDGTITLRANSGLTYFGEYSGNAFGSIVNEGGSIQLRGTLDLLDERFDFDVLTAAANGNLDIQAGIRNGTIESSSNSLIAFDWIQNFSDITFGSDVSFYGGNPQGFNGDITIEAGATMYFGKIPPGVLGGDAGRINVGTPDLPDPVFSGPGEIVAVGGGDNPLFYLFDTNFNTLTIGPDLTVRTDGGSFTFSAINEGTLIAGSPGDTIRLFNRYPGQFNNLGTIQVNQGARLFIDDGVTLDSLGTLTVDQDGEIYVVGTMDLQGQTLNIGSYGGRWYLAGQNTSNNDPGWISNGRIETGASSIGPGVTGIGFFDGEGTLENITLAGTILVDGGQRLNLRSGITLDNGTIQIGGDDIIDGVVTGGSDGEVRVFGDTFNLLGNGEVVFTGAGSRNELDIFNNGFNGIDLVTIASGIIIKTDGNQGYFENGGERLENAGTFSADGDFLNVFTPVSTFEFRNLAGVLEARNGGTLWVNGLAGDVGTLRIENEGKIVLGGDYERFPTLAGNYRISENLTLDNAETLALHGTVDIGSAITVNNGGKLILDADWTNTGTINVAAGGTLDIEQLPTAIGSMNLNGSLALSGEFSTDDLLSLPLSNSNLAISWKNGYLQNTGKTLTIGSDIRGLAVEGGTIAGGAIDSIAGEKLVVNHGSSTNTLLGVQDIRADIDVINGLLSLEQSSWSGQITIANGYGAVDISGDGWNNLGGIVATDTWVSIAGAPSTLGSFDLTSSSLVVQNELTSAELQAAVTGQESLVLVRYTGYVDAEGQPIDRGVIDNSGNSITLDQTTLNWQLSGGIISGGSIQPAVDEVLQVVSRGGTLDAVVSNAAINIEPGAGLTFMGSNWENNGGIQATNASVTIAGTPAVLGDINLTDSILFLEAGLTTAELETAVTGPTGSIVTRTGATVDNTGDTITLDPDNYDWGFSGGTIIGGRIERLADEIVNISGQVTFDGVQVDAPILVDYGHLTFTGSAWENLGGVIAQNASVTLGGAPTTLGTFDLSGENLFLRSTFTTAELQTAITGQPYSVRIKSGGELDNTGNAITSDRDATEWVLEGGTLRGGIVQGPQFVAASNTNAPPHSLNASSFNVDPGPPPVQYFTVTHESAIRGAEIRMPILLRQSFGIESVGIPTVLEISDGAIASEGVLFGAVFDAGAKLQLGPNQTLDGFGDIVFGSGSTTENQIVGYTEPDTNDPTPQFLVPVEQNILTEQDASGTVGSEWNDLIIRGKLTANGPASELHLVGSSILIDGGELESIDGGSFVFNGSIENQGTLTLAGGTSYFNEDYHQGQGAQIALEDNASVIFNQAFSGSGSFTGNGTVRFESDFRPGNSPGSVSFQGDMQLANTSRTYIEIAGGQPGSGYDQITADGNASIEGILEIALIDSYLPQPYQSYTVLSSGQRTGTFEQIKGIQSAPGWGFAATYTESGVILTNALLGDANLDGDVDVFQFDGGGDAQILSSHLGSTMGMTWADGDFNGDGDVDVFQFDGGGDAQLLSSNIGSSTQLSSSSARFSLASSVSTNAAAGTAVAIYNVTTGELFFDIGSGVAVVGLESVGNVLPGGIDNSSLFGVPGQLNDDSIAFFNPTGLPIGEDSLGLVLSPGLGQSDLGFSYTPVGGTSTITDVTIVPEPSSLALIATLGLVFSRRLRAA